MESEQSARQSGDRPVETDEHIGRNYLKRGRVNPELAEEGRICKKGTTSNPELPDEVIETIFVRSGFPGVLMARFMSRTWRDKFKSVADLKDKTKKEAAMVFQNQISKSVLTWKTSYPILFCEESCSTIYAVPLKKPAVPLVSFLPERIQRRWSPILLDLTESRWSPVFLDLDSALLLMCNRSKDKFYVVNILTRSFKVLPPCPKRGRRISLCCSKLVTSSNSYKVVIFSKERPDARYTRQRPAAKCFVQIYDSRVQTWSHHNINPQAIFETLSQPVFIGGILYMVIDNDPARLGSLDLASCQYVEFRLRVAGRLDIDRLKRFVTAVNHCHSNDKLVIGVTIQVQVQTHLWVLKVDIITHTMRFVRAVRNIDTPGQCTPAGRRIRFNTVLRGSHTSYCFISGFPSAVQGLIFYGDVHLCPFLPDSNLFLEV